MCCALEPGQAHSRVLVGGSGGYVTSIDLVSSKRVAQVRELSCRLPIVPITDQQGDPAAL